jgi:beta-glucosidase
MKKLLIIPMALSILFCHAQNPKSVNRINQQEKEMNLFVGSLMKKMTLEEKLGQLNLVTPMIKTGPFATKNFNSKLKDGSAGNVYGIMSPNTMQSKLRLADSTRLKIPMINGLDIIHGYKTVFPIPLGLSCSWDTVLVEKTARIAAIEATSVGYNWTFSPMVDLTRDPRWGRVMEGSGEDPYLGGLIARAIVKGYQGNDLKSETSMMACVKHFAMYGAAEAGRDYNTTDMSRISMYQNYLPPYKAAVDAGAASIMTSFNEVDGVPATANKWLFTDLLRKEWGFKGFVVTDFNAIQELMNHGVAADTKEAAQLAINAGIDMDMVSESILANTKQLLKEGKITIAQIDAACRRVLEAKYKLGLFQNPDRNYSPEKAAKVILTTENKLLAKEAAMKSMVLLKNDNHILPLKKETKIALIGPFADDKREMFSMWSFTGDASKVVTILDGIKTQNPNVTFAKGTLLSNDTVFNRKSFSKFDAAEQLKLEDQALQQAQNADVIVAVLGESVSMSGEASSKTDISLSDCQRELLKRLKANGKPVVWLLMNGRPMTIESDMRYADAILDIWRPGTSAGDAVADVLFGNYNPSGKLTMTFPRSVGQIPIYYNHKNTGRPYTPGQTEKFVSNYIDEQNSPLFPFGYGLSYTRFSYSNITLSDTLLQGEKKILTASIRITNTGKYAGEETVQLYLNDCVASVARPVKELKDFKKIMLQPGETREVSFSITPEQLKFYNSNLKYDWESGEFIVYIGTNSDNVQSAKFRWMKL